MAEIKRDRERGGGERERVGRHVWGEVHIGRGSRLTWSVGAVVSTRTCGEKGGERVFPPGKGEKRERTLTERKREEEAEKRRSKRLSRATTERSLIAKR